MYNVSYPNIWHLSFYWYNDGTFNSRSDKMKSECSVCKEAVEKDDIESHAADHFKTMQGRDALGNIIPSQETITFIPIDR